MSQETLHSRHQLNRRQFFPVLVGGLIGGVGLYLNTKRDKGNITPSSVVQGDNGTVPPQPQTEAYLATVSKDAQPGSEIITDSELNKYSEAINKGVEFLSNRLNRQLGLLNASPIAEKDHYWLTNDNKLAANALDATGQKLEVAQTLRNSLSAWGSQRHGVIEVLNGEEITWPPYGDNRVIKSEVDGIQVLLDTRMPPVEGDSADTRGQMQDWAEYADLAFYRVIDLYNQSESTKDIEQKQTLLDDATTLYEQTLSKFDGNGFADKAFTDDENKKKQYTNFKLALAIIAGEKLKEKIDINYDPLILHKLLEMQAKDNINDSLGGITTLSTAENGQDGDANVETTSLSLIAFSMLRDKRMKALQTAQKQLTVTTP